MTFFIFACGAPFLAAITGAPLPGCPLSLVRLLCRSVKTLLYSRLLSWRLGCRLCSSSFLLPLRLPGSNHCIGSILFSEHPELGLMLHGSLLLSLRTLHPGRFHIDHMLLSRQL